MSNRLDAGSRHPLHPSQRPDNWNDSGRSTDSCNADYYNCYPLSEISCTGRATKGVKAIKLDKDGYVKEAKWVGDSSIKNTGRAVKGVKYA